MHFKPAASSHHPHWLSLLLHCRLSPDVSNSTAQSPTSIRLRSLFAAPYDRRPPTLIPISNQVIEAPITGQRLLDAPLRAEYLLKCSAQSYVASLYGISAEVARFVVQNSLLHSKECVFNSFSGAKAMVDVERGRLNRIHHVDRPTLGRYDDSTPEACGDASADNS